MIVTQESLRRLHHLSRLNRHYRDQLEAMAAECCELLSVENDGSDTADLARSIIDHEANVSEVVVKRLMLAASNQ